MKKNSIIKQNDDDNNNNNNRPWLLWGIIMMYLSSAVAVAELRAEVTLLGCPKGGFQEHDLSRGVYIASGSARSWNIQNFRSAPMPSMTISGPAQMTLLGFSLFDIVTWLSGRYAKLKIWPACRGRGNKDGIL